MNNPVYLELARKTIFLVCLTWCWGCQRVTPTSGGTRGVFTVSGKPLSDIQINVYRSSDNAMEKIGFGITDRDGRFQLFTNGAQGPLVLKPGQYRFTLESVGAPVEFPTPYTQPETTPLSVIWSGSEPLIELDIPTVTILDLRL